MSLYSGVFRFLSAKNFVKELVLGYAIELVFTLGLLFLQGVNNVGTQQSDQIKLMIQGKFQAAAIILKLLALLILIIELGILIYEVYRLH